MEEPRTSNISMTCNCLFISPSEVVEHKAMTSHREYTKQE